MDMENKETKEVINPQFEQGDVITRIAFFGTDYGQKLGIQAVDLNAGVYKLANGRNLKIDRQHLYQKVKSK